MNWSTIRFHFETINGLFIVRHKDIVILRKHFNNILPKTQNHSTIIMECGDNQLKMFICRHPKKIVYIQTIIDYINDVVTVIFNVKVIVA